MPSVLMEHGAMAHMDIVSVIPKPKPDSIGEAAIESEVSLVTDLRSAMDTSGSIY